jgi:hypothetical protein
MAARHWRGTGVISEYAASLAGSLAFDPALARYCAYGST